MLFRASGTVLSAPRSAALRRRCSERSTRQTLLLCGAGPTMAVVPNVAQRLGRRASRYASSEALLREVRSGCDSSSLPTTAAAIGSAAWKSYHEPHESLSLFKP